MDDKLEIDYVYHLLKAFLNMSDIVALWVVLTEAFEEGNGNANYH